MIPPPELLSRGITVLADEDDVNCEIVYHVQEFRTYRTPLLIKGSIEYKENSLDLGFKDKAAFITGTDRQIGFGKAIAT
jgi:hypothetical protein